MSYITINHGLYVMEEKMINVKLKSTILEQCGSQIQFAHKLGVSDSFVSKVVRGHIDLQVNQQNEWAEMLDVKPTEIFETGNN